MGTKFQIRIIIAILLVLGCGSALYKNKVLGFSFSPEKQVDTWTIETRISYIANGDDVEISLNLPNQSRSLKVLGVKNVGVGYDFTEEDGRAVWRTSGNTGRDSIYLQAQVALAPDDSFDKKNAFVPNEGVFRGAAEIAADSLITSIDKDLPLLDQATKILQLLTIPDYEEAALLREYASELGGKGQMAASLLGRAGIPASSMRGLLLTETKKNQNLQSYVEVVVDKEHYLLDLLNGQVVPHGAVLLWQQNNESMLDLVGGTRGRLSFSILQGSMAAERVAVLTGKKQESVLIDFSIYSLPIKEQNTFKLLLLIPIGALVVVILRNIVGITTSGTFMPILIALVFLQTSLLSGLALFLTVVGVGLVLRTYLSHLNLLLVPRISAVLVFVIIIYVAISVISVKLNFDIGLQVTFFPMIIISWTIERMSILWEEEGPMDVLKQGGGSLFAASLIYFAMSNTYIGHLTYSFPELLLVVLAIIIMIGSYSGYRLTELRRFEPLVKGD